MAINYRHRPELRALPNGHGILQCTGCPAIIHKCLCKNHKRIFWSRCSVCKQKTRVNELIAKGDRY